jgi:hypothetical protein
MKFVEKNIIDFKNSIKNIFDLITIEGHYKIIGSSALKKILYNSDYDLAENDNFKNLANGQEFLKKRFKDIFKEVAKDKNIFITDFKCGIDSDGEPLRWKKEDIDKGYKILKNGKEQTFERSLIDKNNTIKIDVISLIDGVFVDFSENLYFKFGEGNNAITNYNISDLTKPKILASIKSDFFDKIKDGKYLKALKRKFAYYKLLDTDKYKPLLDELVDFFNSEVGIVGKAYADIETIVLILETNFKKVNIKDVKNNLQNIKQNLSYCPNLEPVSETINNICKSNNKKTIVNKLNRLNNKLFKFITKETLKQYKLKHYSKKKI